MKWQYRKQEKSGYNKMVSRRTTTYKDFAVFKETEDYPEKWSDWE
jgi:hypothetical protein